MKNVRAARAEEHAITLGLVLPAHRFRPHPANVAADAARHAGPGAYLASDRPEYEGGLVTASGTAVPGSGAVQPLAYGEPDTAQPAAGFRAETAAGVPAEASVPAGTAVRGDGLA
jgi:hypothetical protein